MFGARRSTAFRSVPTFASDAPTHVARRVDRPDVSTLGNTHRGNGFPGLPDATRSSSASTESGDGAATLTTGGLAQAAMTQ